MLLFILLKKRQHHNSNLDRRFGKQMPYLMSLYTASKFLSYRNYTCNFNKCNV